MKMFNEQYIIDNNGILVESERSVITTAYTAKRHDNYMEIEDNSWWYIYRASVVRWFAEKYFNQRMVTIDLGGGNGFNTYDLQQNDYEVMLVEPGYQGCLNAKRRGVNHVVNATFSEESVTNHSVNQLMMLDVLEHIEDDESFLRLLHDKMADDGLAIITVPAFQTLWSSEDEIDGHFRRYSIEELCKKTGNTGFDIEYINYFFGFLYLPIFFARHLGEKMHLLKRVEDRSEKEKEKVQDREFKQRKGLVGFVLDKFESIEFKKLTSNKRIKRGSSIICVLKKSHL